MENEQQYTIIFRHGHVVGTRPKFNGDLYENGDIIYSANSIISDGIPYSLIDKDSIYSIDIPKYKSVDTFGIDLGVTGCLDYDLRMRAGRHWNEGHYALSIACLEKATSMMQYSSIGWPKRDYYRIVNELTDLGRLKKAKEWENWIDNNIHIPEYTDEDRLKTLFQSCDLLGTDLVMAYNISACCEKCAKYRNRIYRIRDTNLRFPKLPADYHTDCGLVLASFSYELFDSPFPGKNTVLYSNRPFVDDRSDEEKAAYQKRLDIARRRQEEILWAKPNPARTSYYLLKKYFPNDAPKSMSGFSRMRNANSKRYQALIKKAHDAGISLPETIDDLYDMEKRGEFE